MKQLEQKHKDLLSELSGDDKAQYIDHLKKGGYDLNIQDLTDASGAEFVASIADELNGIDITYAPIQTTLSDEIKDAFGEPELVDYEAEGFKTADEFLDSLFVTSYKQNASQKFKLVHANVNKLFPNSLIGVQLGEENGKFYIIATMTTVSYNLEMDLSRKEKPNVFDLLDDCRNTAVQHNNERGITAVTFEILDK